MNRIIIFFKKLRTNITFSATNPKTFKEVFSFSSNGVRVISLFGLFLMLFATFVIYLTGGFQIDERSKSVDRVLLEKQTLRVDSLTRQLIAQENFIHNIQQILKGELPVNTPIDSVVLKDMDLTQINTDETDVEKAISKKVKMDLMTNSDINEKKNITYFASPVFGVVSQAFDLKKHPGIDIVTTKDEVVKACLSGTVIYSGFTRSDGNVIIIEHGSNYISIYKHNKRNLKKAGTKVQLGDPISIVGDTGENSDGPHLHFELWQDQQPVNPINYMNFKR